MKAIKTQRFMMALFLLLILSLYNTGMTTVASAMMIFMITLIVIWAVFDFCPSIHFLSKFFKEDSICQAK